ncbi:ATP-dependent endonuclease [Frondihabitans sp. VKM Ac-2883]|uniref:ATP-dependent nuclease n=1 Tax=Frondihabitans sp. VKM Ac-2883 TaxID=2783823 RepID=UPI001889D01A|nr:AAA family ATPase [Frondihabitans sp. VKM Ac-2883]MBF4577884.1 AAA family ATPase [Frondihabitans sp. VKM Ac-2883]
MRLQSIRLENIGGFTTTDFNLENDALLIGENNSGKTSLLRSINWVLNDLDDQLLIGRRDLTHAEEQLLLPARATRNRARRIFLRVHISDGRSAKKFGADQAGIAEVRIQFRQGNNYARLGVPERGEAPETEPNAIELIGRLQDEYACLYIPATRDGSSALFAGLLRTALRKRLQEHMIYDGLGRPAGVPKATGDAADRLSENASDMARTVWDDARDLIQCGFEPSGTFSAKVSPADLVELAISQMEPRFSTGEHDLETVSVAGLGAGLQSVLTMAVAQLSLASESNQLLLLEEPEAFLHPSAQRTIAQQIFSKAGTQTIATTHSSAILAEVAPSNVVVLKAHSAFPAAEASSAQNAKDRYFLSSLVSHAMFDRSLLLVEGPGDVAFFESLRRQLYDHLPPSVLNRMRVCATGSKTAFGPWLRLLRRYVNPGSGELAYNVLICADSIDAGSDVVRALRESGVVVPITLTGAIAAIATGLDTKANADDSPEMSARTAAINTTAMALDVPVHFSAIDLEYSMLENVSDVRALQFAAAQSIDATSCHDLMARMGSKGTTLSASDKAGAKAPYVRAELAQWLTWDEVPANVKSLLWRWALGAKDAGQQLERPAVLL